MAYPLRASETVIHRPYELFKPDGVSALVVMASAIFVSHPGGVVFDDGVGDSPPLTFIGGSDDTYTIFCEDAIAGNSDLVFTMPAADADARFIWRNSTPADVAWVDAAGNAYFLGNVGIGAGSVTKLQVDRLAAFSLATAETGQDNIFLKSYTAAGIGVYGASIKFSRVDGTASIRGGSGIVAVQTHADPDRMGLAFFVHPSVTATDDSVEAVRITHTGHTGFGAAFPNRLTHAEAADAVTNAVTYAQRLGHVSSGAAAALFGVGAEHELKDGGGAMQVASEVVTIWADPTAGAESPLRRWTTYPAGVAGPGYEGFWTFPAIAGVAVTMIPNGAGDVPSGLIAMYRLSESGGGVDGNVIMVDNNGNVDIYDDGTDVFNLAVAADGSVTVVRTAGAATADLAIHIVWL